MKLEFSAPIEDLTIANPVINNVDKVACSKVTDAEGNPFVIKIHTSATETIHDAKNRAWVDVTLVDDDCVKVFEQLDEHVLNTVYNQHDTAEWFDRKAPREIIEDYCKSFIEYQKSKPNPFLRLKTGYHTGEPRVELHTSTQKNPESATISEINTLDTLAGREVVYEVHVGSIRFCPTTFNPELKLVAVHSYVAKEDYNMFDMVLHNATHREQREKILEKQQKMEEYTETLRQLEALKTDVENEVTQIMAKQEDVNERYNDAMEKITAMQMECVFGDEVDEDDEEEVGTEENTETNDAVDTVVADNTNDETATVQATNTDGGQPEAKVEASA
jgi:hypothetical protein